MIIKGKTIDKIRGNFGRVGFSCFGDYRYDLAKLRHSFCGDYEFIIADQFLLSILKPSYFELVIDKQLDFSPDELFNNLCSTYGHDIQQVRCIEASLFLSLLPFHSDNESRQLAFFLIGIQKMNEYFYDYNP